MQNQYKELCWPDNLDAHFFAGEDVDFRPACFKKPFVHLHTQFNRDLPWSSIDMDFMNLNQFAHGDREVRFHRKQDAAEPQGDRRLLAGRGGVGQPGHFGAAACAWHDMQGENCPFGDNMRDVAVTEGDKVEAQIHFGYSVNGYGVGELVKYVNEATDATIDKLMAKYGSICSCCCVCAGMACNVFARGRSDRTWDEGLPGRRQFQSLYYHLEDLHGPAQLPGLAVNANGQWLWLRSGRRLEDRGVGAGDESHEQWDGGALPSWKITPMTLNLPSPKCWALICWRWARESIAGKKPSLEIHPLSIGGKADPPRLYSMFRRDWQSTQPYWI